MGSIRREKLIDQTMAEVVLLRAEVNDLKENFRLLGEYCEKIMDLVEKIQSDRVRGRQKDKP